MSAEAPPTPPTPEQADNPARSRRRLWIVVGTVVVVALAAGGFFFGQPDPGVDRSDEGIAPDINLPDLRGDGEIVLANLRGRPVVVNFFASWCVPCRKEMPAFQAVSTRLGDKVAFLGIDHKDNRDGGRQLLADTGVRYPTAYDPDGAVATRYGLFGMPTTVFIGADGRILDKHTGEMSEADLQEAISTLFGITR